jgi:hypothetical protein
MDLLGLTQVSTVKRVQIVILISDGEIESFHWIPADFVGPQSHDHLPQRLSFPLIVQNNTAITSTGRQEIILHGIELNVVQ